LFICYSIELHVVLALMICRIHVWVVTEDEVGERLDGHPKCLVFLKVSSLRCAVIYCCRCCCELAF